MISAFILAASLAGGAHAEPAANKTEPPARAHEAGEDKARTVPGGASKGVKACHSDVERFCRGIKAGEGRLGACLKANVKKLSKRCRRWASHGGPEHMSEALSRDIDGAAPDAPAAPEKK